LCTLAGVSEAQLYFSYAYLRNRFKPHEEAAATTATSVTGDPNLMAAVTVPTITAAAATALAVNIAITVTTDNFSAGSAPLKLQLKPGAQVGTISCDCLQ